VVAIASGSITPAPPQGVHVRKPLTEFIGTFFLVLTIGLTVANGTTFAPLAIGMALMIMVYMGGHVSGGHYNPAVSLAVMIRGKLNGREFGTYVVAQLLGAMVATEVASMLAGKMVAPAPGAGVSTMAALLVEILFTFALALMVLNVAVSEKTKGNSFYGLAIGMTVATGAFAGGGISGGAFNPAVGLGMGIVNGIMSGASMTHLWLYLVGPAVGGALAAVVFGIQESGQ
jgi:aquaporin Z